MFFQKNENLAIISDFIRRANETIISDEKRSSRLQLAKEIISYIHREPEKWDEKCTFNIKHIGSQFINALQYFDPKKLADIDFIYVFSYRFLCEFDFFVGPGKELSIGLSDIKRKIQEDNNHIDDNLKSQIIYASFTMPANIAKELMNDANIIAFREFEKKKAEAENLKTAWDTEIKNKEDTVTALKDKLEEYKIGFNFVGLYNGFDSLFQKKSDELKWLFRSLITMGLFVLTPLSAEIVISLLGIYESKFQGVSRLYTFIPLASIEIILIYYFRVILSHYMSVKAQIIQIELRKTLCQFIQSYADYSTNIKKQNSNALEKFENLIFSGVLIDPEKLPSTFDGIEQISSLIKNFKSS